MLSSVFLPSQKTKTYTLYMLNDFLLSFMANILKIFSAFVKEDNIISIFSLQRGEKTMGRKLHATNIGGIKAA